MYKKLFLKLLLVSACAVFALHAGPKSIELQRAGRFATNHPVLDQGAAEIVTFDPDSKRIFFINGAAQTLNVLDGSAATIANPPLLFTCSLTQGGVNYGNPTSVAVHNGLVAVAGEKGVAPGYAVFFDTSCNFIRAIQTGVLPDMITFTPNGKYVLTADEGQPSDDYTVDPEGSVTIIRLKENGRDCRDLVDVRFTKVTIARFTKFNNTKLDPSIRIYGPGSSVAQDLEPEYIAVSKDSEAAWVTLQEANAIAVLDISKGEFTKLIGLGFKDHSLPGNALDPSDRDSSTVANGPSIKIGNWPLFGMYEPDGIAAFKAKGKTYLITANEGDTRAYSGFNEEVAVSALTLTSPLTDALKANAQLGRLTVTKSNGKVDPACTTGCVYNSLYVPGGRSFSIWKTDGKQVFDSGDQFEQIVAAQFPANFNANHTSNALDNRSDNKGPEPESVVVGKIKGRLYAFIGLERMSGVMVFDVTNPEKPKFVQYFNDRNFAITPAPGDTNDLGPEGLKFVPARKSPLGVPLLLVGNEVSGSVGILKIISTGGDAKEADDEDDEDEDE